jgi:hypothetical protein
VGSRSVEPAFNRMTTPGRSAGLGFVLLLLAGCASKQPVPVGDFTEPVAQPVWKAGDEWAYRYDGASGSGTFIWRVDRTENLAGVPHYIVTAGPREIFYRVDDLGFTRETLDGKISREISPSAWRVVAFPLRVGQSWSMKYVERRPIEGETESVERRCVAEKQETVTVPAGTFAAIRVVCTNTRANAWVLTLWYAPVVHHMVKDEYPLRTGGRSSRELLKFSLK